MSFHFVCKPAFLIKLVFQTTRMTDEERQANSRERPIHLTLVSFAVTRKAYEVITARFADEYEQATGTPVKFRLSFGGSGTQASPSKPSSACDMPSQCTQLQGQANYLASVLL